MVSLPVCRIVSVSKSYSEESGIAWFLWPTNFRGLRFYQAAS